MIFERLSSNFAQQAELNSFCIKDKYYSYKQLGSRVAAIQSELLLNKGKSKTVGVITNDDFDTYASLLAVWYSGMAYVPISLKNPIDRNNTVLNEADVEIILTSENLELAFGKAGLKTILTIELPDKNSIPVSENFTVTDNAYILFTSGSTGVPKGVPISYQNLFSFVESFEDLPIEIGKDERCLQMFELTFDVSVASFLMPLLNGACVYTVPSNVVKYLHIIKLIGEYKLTNITIVPSVISLLKPYLKQLRFECVKHCILTAEATYVDLLTGWADVIPAARIWNLYGPTEATIWCTYYEFNKSSISEYNGMFAIGAPLKNVEALIVNEKFEPVNSDEKGELCIGGQHVTPGYLNNQERNVLSFFTRMVGGKEVRFYKTGDLCFYDEKNVINYCGRLDNQVQIQGFRVELSEIEVLVRNQFSISNVVIPRKNKVNALELLLVLEKYSGNIDEVKNYLAKKLPPYMMPEQIYKLDEFPLNSSGKIDRVKIKEGLK